MRSANKWPLWPVSLAWRRPMRDSREWLASEPAASFGVISLARERRAEWGAPSDRVIGSPIGAWLAGEPPRLQAAASGSAPCAEPKRRPARGKRLCGSSLAHWWRGPALTRADKWGGGAKQRWSALVPVGWPRAPRPPPGPTLGPRTTTNVITNT